MARKKVSRTITLPPELMEYIEEKVENRVFDTVAHGIEVCVLRYKEADERGEIPPV